MLLMVLIWRLLWIEEWEEWVVVGKELIKELRHGVVRQPYALQFMRVSGKVIRAASL
jgi:hypothetical protein